MSEHSLIQTEIVTTGIRISVVGNDMAEHGHVFVYFIPNEVRQRPYALLEDLLVSEHERGRGVGTILLDRAIEVAKERGCYKIIGTSRTSRHEVHAWYLRKGFEQYGYEFRMELEGVV